MQKTRIILISLTSLVLNNCTDTVERLRRVGQAPNLAQVTLPIEDEDALDPEQQEAIFQQRKRNTNSLWHPGSTTFFRDSRAWRIGDIVKVVVQISDKAQLNNSSTQTRTGNDSLGVTSLFGKEKSIATVVSKNGKPTGLIGTKTGRNHEGTGAITRNEAIRTVIAAVVTQILPNGNLVIQGHQEIRVNYELREVKVTGIIRPRDIGANNDISSDQIAEARISYGGKGIMSDIQQPRVGSQVIDIISPF